MTHKDIPYFCQWESPELAHDIVLGKATPADDPLWKNSGAKNLEDYTKWANHICGIACLKMVLATLKNRIVPTLELTQQSISYGAYTVSGSKIKGLIYAPFIKYIQQTFDIESQIEIDKKAKDIPALLKTGCFFIASVHPDIRWIERTPPQKGGHLVLVTAANDDHITFHNPSGHKTETQENVMVSPQDFDRFFAGRGILIDK